MTKIAAPRTTDAAIRLLERYAVLQGGIDEAEASRGEMIAHANKLADEHAQPLLEERAAIAAKLEPWWGANAVSLTDGKRKSIELGGCMIGSRVGKASLDIAGDELTIVKSLQRRKWAQDLLRVKVTLDRTAILKALGGAYKKQLATLGLRRKEGEETFFIERAEQSGTLAGAGQ